MRDWPWVTIIFVAFFTGWFLHGWLGGILFYGAILGAVAYSVHVRRLT